MTKLVHVAVGVIEDSCGNIFIAQRAADAHQGGLWEFPGGKLEAGETTPQALQRELREELAIEVECCEPLIQIRHHYPDKSVLLDVYRVTQFHGQPTGNEGQPVLWVNKAELVNYSFPAANKPIVKAVVLPDRLAITGAFASSEGFTEKLTRVFQMGLSGAILRIENMSPQTHLDLVSSASLLAHKQKALLQLNTSLKNYLLFMEHLNTTSVGLHMNRHELMAHHQRPVAQEILLGASCHNPLELAKAAELGVDYILLSPVLPTNSHPDADSLGWQVFTDWVSSVNIPVYALGGMSDDHVVQAKHCGAQGVASISAWWSN